MNRVWALLNWVLTALGQRSADRNVGKVQREMAALAGLTDDELRAHCRALSSGRVPSRGERTSELWSFLRFFRHFRSHRSLDPLVVSLLSAGGEAFNRSPADLPDGSRIFPEQIRAAVALVKPSIVQMDTGEGKTYALLPAAFALAADFPRVFIVCANPYLAARDAIRTRSYWEFVGISTGLALEGSNEKEWERHVVYTTLEQLIFRSMQNDLRETPPPVVPTSAAVLVDDADYSLIDRANQPYSLSRYVSAELFDWEFANSYVERLQEGRDVVVDHRDLSAQLTPDAETALFESLPPESQEPARFLLVRFAVETAFVAKVVHRDVHYVIRQDSIMAVDPVTGRMSSVVWDWLSPLAARLGLPPPPRSVQLHAQTSFPFLMGVAHLAGLSGTADTEALEYLLAYHLWPVVIPPRRPRHQGLTPDLIFRTKKAAIRAAVRLASEAAGAGRPVLIGTQSIADAESCYSGLLASDQVHGRIALVTAKNDREAAALYERAGEAGSVLVATQLAGRGVDVRLTEESRRNGGLALICVSHALEARFDRQFLGRAGRQGDPYSARFVCALDDSLMKMLSSRRVAGLMRTLHWPEDEPLQAAIISQAIRTGQSQIRLGEFLRRRQRAYLDLADAEVLDQLRVWVAYAQTLAPQRGRERNSWQVSQGFVDRAVAHFVEGALGLKPEGRRRLDEGRSRRIEEALREAFPTIRPVITSYELVSLDEVAAFQRVSAGLKKAITSAQSANTKALKAFEAAVADIASDLDRYRTLDARIREVAGRLVAGEEDEAATIEILESVATEAGMRDLGAVVPAAAGSDGIVERSTSSHGWPATVSEGPADDAGRRALLDRLQAANEALGERWNMRVAEYRRIQKEARTSRSALFTAIQIDWSAFLAEHDRIWHRTSQQHLSALEFWRQLRQRVRLEWRKTETSLVRDSLNALVRSADPAAVADLFIWQDQAITVSRPANEETLMAREWAGTTTDGKPPVRRQRGHLIEQFIEAFGQELAQSGISTTNLRQLLRDFLDLAPLTTLQAPDAIHTALRSWSQHERERGWSYERIRQNHAWLKRFLTYLSDRHYVGPLPKARDRAYGLLRQVRLSLTEPRSAIPILAGLSFMAAFAAASLVHVGQVHVLSPSYRLLDDLVSGGLLRHGALTGPAIAAVVIGLLTMFLITPNAASVPKGVGREPAIVFAVQVLLCAWVTRWPAQPAGSEILSSIGAFLLMVLVARVCQLTIWPLENSTGISLVSGWLGGTIAVSLVPDVARISGSRVAVMAVAGALVLVRFLWRMTRRSEVEVFSTYVEGATALKEGQSTITAIPVDTAAGVTPYVQAALIASIVANIIGHPLGSRGVRVGLLECLPAFVYMSVVAFSTHRVLADRLSPKGWRELLSARRQVIVGVRTNEELRGFLIRKQLAVTTSEIAFELLLSLGAFFVLSAMISSNVLALTTAIALLAGSGMFVPLGRSFGSGVRSLLAGGSRISYEAIELPGPERGDESPLERVVRVTRRHVMLVFGVVTFITKFFFAIRDLLHRWGIP